MAHHRGMETYHGHVRTPPDAIILFEACRLGILPRVQRRLSEKERQSIKSGSVFVWDEREAGMRRWTDGKSWSASRVSGSFLTYREMEGKRGGNVYTAQPGKKPNGANGKAQEGSSTKGSDEEMEGADEGPDGYRYKPDGLMKQSFSITTSTGQHLHLISYFSRSSSATQALPQPSTDPNLRHIRPAKGMYPEAAIHEQGNSPLVVARGPLPPGPYPVSPQLAGLPGYARHAAQVNFVPHPGYWQPHPIAGHPNQQYLPYGYPNGGSPPGSGQLAHSPMQYGRQQYPGHPQPVRGPTAFDRAPAPLTNGTLPPPPPAAHIHNSHQLPSQALAPSPQYIPNPSPRGSQASEMANMRGTYPPGRQQAVDPALSNIDPRLAAPPGPYSYQHPASPPLNRDHGPTSHTSVAPQGTAADSGTNGKLIPSIDALMNPASEERTEAKSEKSNKGNRSHRSRSRSPRGPDTAQDKVGFREDMRALRQLDKAFAA